MAKYAAIDVGTNTVLLLVAERRGREFVPLVERAEITRLGRGVDHSGRLDPAAIRATVEVLARYAGEARSLGAQDIACVATSAARDAANGAEFFEGARARAGLSPEVITGDEEARLVWASAWRDFGAPGQRLAVVDVGGGSTEVCTGEGPEPQARRSFQVGAVRLTERVAPPDPMDAQSLARMRRDAAEALAPAASLLETAPLPADAGRGRPQTGIEPRPSPLPSPRSRGARRIHSNRGDDLDAPEETSLEGGGSGRGSSIMVAVAGTVTTLAAVQRALPVYDAGVVHGAELSYAALEALYGRLGALTTAERARLPGMEPKRADVIVAGCAVLLEAMRALGFDRLTVSDRGVRWGLLYDRFASEGGA